MYTLRLEPKRAKDRSETLDPIAIKSRTDMTLPALATVIRLNAEPNLTLPRTEIADPMLMKSITETELPQRIQLNTLVVEPKRMKLLNDRLEPRET